MSASLLGAPLSAYAAEWGTAATVSETTLQAVDAAADEETVIVLIESGADTAPEGTLSAITLPVSQAFRTNQGDTNTAVQYRLTPVEELQDAGYSVDTPAAVSGGLVSFQADGAGLNQESFTITGDASAGIALSAAAPGMYVFDLTVTSEDDAANAYRYDHNTYHLRFYVRDGGEAFLTAQNSAGDKVAALSYSHERWIDGGSRDGGQNGGGGTSTTPGGDGGQIVEPGSLTEDGSTTAQTVGEISEDGSILSQIIERGSAGPLTGDMSHMMLYGAVMLMGIAGLVIWRKFHY